ncbi:MAG: Mur ligase domain-containing protein, partial [Pseudomonadota bacterium]
MTLKDLFDDLDGPAGEREILGLTADSRKVEPGYLFAAFKGMAADGRDYIPQALENGAVAVLSDRRLPNASRGAGVVEVVDNEPRLAFA